MASLWPWLAVAGLGALHGLNPATGWMWAAAWGVRSRDRAEALRALVPIALGHAVSVALVAVAVGLGLAMDRTALQAGAAMLLAIALLIHFSGRARLHVRASAGRAGLALWSFMIATAHGAGLMLVPALIPLCMGDGSAGALSMSGSLMQAFAAVGVHAAAMLLVTGMLASGCCRCFEAAARRRSGGAGCAAPVGLNLAGDPNSPHPMAAAFRAPEGREA